MASNTDAPAKQSFVVWAPDYPDALERRLAVRVQHSEGVKRLVAEGVIKLGAPMSDPTSDKMNGSLLVVEAESAAAVRAIIEKDVYWASNVWDKEKLEIRSIVIAFNVR